MTLKLLLFYALILAGCSTEKPLIKQAAKNNATYTIEYLFEHDGCKVYRFRDDGHYVYFTSCKGETTSIKSDSSGTKYIKSINSKN